MAMNDLLGKTLGRFGLQVVDGTKPQTSTAIVPHVMHATPRLDLRGFTESEQRRFLQELRSSLENPQTPLSYPAEWLLDIFNGGRTDSGLRVSEMTALEVATVFQCVTIIANGIAASPLHVMLRDIKDNRVSSSIAYDHALYDLLNSEPNPEMTSTTWRRTMQCHKLLWGNAYSEIQRDGANRIQAIWPRNPARTRPVRLNSFMRMEGTMYPAGTMMYETFDPMGDSQIMSQDSDNQNYGYRRLVLAEDMLHLPGLSLDGRLGQDVVQLSRQVIGLALATEKYGAKFFGNGAIPQGLLVQPQDMTETQTDTMKRSWMEQHGGENTHRTGVLPPGVTYTKIGATPEEGQMLATRLHQKSEIASVFNVPGHMVGVNGDDAGKSTVEQSSIEFNLFCVGPHIVDWKQELKRKLFPKVGQSAKKYFAHFDTRHLMYPDAASRSTFYGSGKQWGYLTSNDIRELEGMNPVTDGSGDKLWMPNNMVDAAMSATHADQVTDALNDGTLAATPTGTTPVGAHPVVKAQEKATKQAQATDLAKHKMTTDASVKIAKSQPKDGDTPKPAGKDVKPSKVKKREDMNRVFAGLFRDAVGRAANRKKSTAVDYGVIFGPVVSAMAEAAFGEEVDSAKFIREYSEALHTRMADKWGEDLDAVASKEREHLVEAIVRN